MNDKNIFDHLPLGKERAFEQHYNPNLLCTINRNEARKKLLSHRSNEFNFQSFPFGGYDIWNAYEVSWLNHKGKPEVAILEFCLVCMSELLLESKSFKLYLGSLNYQRFDSWQAVIKTIESDLYAVLGVLVEVQLQTIEQFSHAASSEWEGITLDDLEVEIDQYHYTPDLLEIESSEVSLETYHSHLLRTVCPVTGQPDWASILIRYSGRKIKAQSLLRYLVSLRGHCIFHEMAIETIFLDLFERCQPQKLTVYGRFTRRGGVDINPFRSNFESSIANYKMIRQ